MKELVGRLTALDPEASETLKVVSYFDLLVAGGAGVEAILRGAATLTGVPAGARFGDRVTRVGADGRRMIGGDPAGWLAHEVGPDSVAWIERAGERHVNDVMVVERLAIALAITSARRAASPEGAVEVAVSSAASAEERGTAIARLRLDGERTLRAVAFRASERVTMTGPNSVVATPRGLARVLIARDIATMTAAMQGESSTRVGIGLPVTPDRLPESWDSALIALRLSDDREPVVDAADLGAVLLLAAAADAGAALHPDAADLSALDARARATLDALEETGSLRAAAARLGMHHSTIQARVAALAEELGYDPRSPRGRTRYALARALLALSRPGLG
ncbi:LysR family transcriptional regulator [Agromyces sp. SYSU K20354]|uniref:helix-turn-helix domain-containing protein n=1 Tax=Agromyces cavernae TaxID=2898659 RepID=UPI001E4FB964|nr:LysR family transcriptional regulator [Agromyces cavernae]MCD2440823.1 LysR family transcriptional regulator [Agromyces cavernae]